MPESSLNAAVSFTFYRPDCAKWWWFRPHSGRLANNPQSPSSLSVGWKIEWWGFSPKVRGASVGRGAGGGRASSLFLVDDNLLDDIHPLLLCAWMRSPERKRELGVWVLFVFIFHVLQLLPPIRFTQPNLCFVSNSIMKHIKKNRTESWTSHALVMAFGSACLSVSWLDTWIPPIVFIVEWRVVICIWKHGPISFEHVSLWCLLFGPH
jgi:hypothetical protein